jgi:hypothetical protein
MTVSSVILQHVDWWKSADISEVPAASIIIALKMDAATISETLVNFHQTTQHNIPQDSYLHTCCHENLKPHPCLFLSNRCTF